MESRIGLFGGTFDPIHTGHLRLAQEWLEQLALDTVVWIPTGQPPHRSAPIANPHARLTMCQLATASHPQFRCDSREIDRPGPSYCVDTLRSFRQEFPHSALFWLIGEDAFRQIQTWSRWTQILDLCHLAVVNRPQAYATDPAFDTWVAQHLAQPEDAAETHGKIWQWAMAPLAISSTQIRARIGEGRSAQYWLPEAVWQFIQSEGLYRGERSAVR